MQIRLCVLNEIAGCFVGSVQWFEHAWQPCHAHHHVPLAAIPFHFRGDGHELIILSSCLTILDIGFHSFGMLTHQPIRHHPNDDPSCSS